MQKLQDSVFSLVSTKNLSPSVFSYLQPTDNRSDITPLGGIFIDTKFGWLALGPKFCVIDLRTGLKIAAWTFGGTLSKQAKVRSVVELPTPLTDRSHQLLISVETDDNAGLICAFHVNGSQILHVIKTNSVVTNLSVSDNIPDGPFTCFDGIVYCGTNTGGIFIYDLNRTLLLQALNDISLGNEEDIRNESSPASFEFIPINNLRYIQEERDNTLEENKHLAAALNEDFFVDNQYLFKNPDGSIRMKAKIGHVHVSTIQYIPQLGSVAVGFNFGAFQIWNLMTLSLEFTSQVNIECLPVTHFGFQEPCDDPRASSYLWVIYSVLDRFEEEQFPLAVMYALDYQNKQMLTDNIYLYDKFMSSKIVFQLELSTIEGTFSNVVGGKCVACHTYSLASSLADDEEENMLNLCQLIWECWAENADNTAQYGMLLFDLDQWYKAQMPATYRLESSPFMSAINIDLPQGQVRALDLRLAVNSLTRYTHPNRLEEHFYPNSLQYKCICLNTSETTTMSTMGIQRQIINGINEVGPTILLNPTRLYLRCVQAGLTPLYLDGYTTSSAPDDQRRYLLSVALEARLSCFLKRCAHDWAAGAHANTGCTLTFIVDWSWQRAIDLKHNAKELIGPLFTSSSVPDWNLRRCLEHCVRQLSSLSSLLDAVLTKCCNLVVPDALSEIEEKFKAIGTVALYFQVVQWFLNVGLLPERQDMPSDIGRLLGENLVEFYRKRRLKLHRLLESGVEDAANTSCPLLYIDQLIENECGGRKIHNTWIKGGSECAGLYPPPSLYSLLRLYLMPDIAEENKHSLVLYLLLDYCMLYDERLGYEGTIKRLMQFPTMFGLSNTAIKATQAFWHLDHREFDFALDQLQCLTGNTLSTWQHHVVLSSLLAQKKTQAALQYLHVRKPAPVQNKDPNVDGMRVNDHNKLEDWQSCCNLYLARSLVYEALDVIRMVTQNCSTAEEKIDVMEYFYNSCRNTAQLAKILNVTLLPFEEEIFIRFLQNCNEDQSSDILIMYLLQHARYIEAQQYNKNLRDSREIRMREDKNGSQKSLETVIDRDNARDTLVEIMCSSQPAITHKVLQHAVSDSTYKSPIKESAPKPLSVYVHANSPKNTFTYRSTFIQDTIENASETWINKPGTKRGIKRALNIEETPFICTPKLNKSSKSIFGELNSDNYQTPAKKLKLDFSSTPKTGNPPSNVKLSAKVVKEMESLLAMPEIQESSPPWDPHSRSLRDTTPHSILKSRRYEDDASSVDSKYLCESEDDFMDNQSVRTNKSDTSSKHLQFSLPSLTKRKTVPKMVLEEEEDEDDDEENQDRSEENHPLESPPKKLATERIMNRKSYKDNVRSRKSLSPSVSCSLSDDPSTTLESIADIPFTFVKERSVPRQDEEVDHDMAADSPLDRPIRARRAVNSYRSERSITPELTSTHKKNIEIQVNNDAQSESIETVIDITRRSRSRTPERLETSQSTTKLGVITESTEDSNMSPRKVRLRNRSRTPEIEIVNPQAAPSPRTLRSRSKTPELELSRPVTPKPTAKSKKSLTRMVLEHNTFKSINEKAEMNESATITVLEDSSESVTDFTPIKPPQPTSLLDVSLSPIVNKSVLQTPTSFDTSEKIETIVMNTPKSIARDSMYEKSVLQSYESSVADDSRTELVEKVKENLLDTSTSNNSVLRDVSSLLTSDSDMDDIKEQIKPSNTPILSEEIVVIDSDSEEGNTDEETADKPSGDELEEETEGESSDGSESTQEESENGTPQEGSADSDSGGEETKDPQDEGQQEGADEKLVFQKYWAKTIITLDDSNDNTSGSDSNKLFIDENTTESQKNEERKTYEIDDQDSTSRTSEPIDIVTVNEAQEKSIQDSIMTDDNSVQMSENSTLPETCTEKQPILDSKSNEMPDVSSAEIPEVQNQVDVELIEESEPQLQKEQSEPAERDVVDAIIVETDKDKPNEKKEGIIPKRKRSTSKQKETPHEEILHENTSDSVEVEIKESTPSRRRLRTPSTETRAAILEERELTPARRIMTRRASKELSERISEEQERTPSHRIMTRRASKELSERISEEQERTPTRRIMTRRTSKELSEPILEEQELTPSRRTRSKSKDIEGLDTPKNAEVKSSKSRRSILATKAADLDVIPEDGESKNDIASEIVKQSGRLTRKQKTTLATWLDFNEPPSSPVPEEKPQPLRRNSKTASTTTNEESISPTSDRLARMSRAMSEIKSLTKPKPLRRSSVDVGNMSPADLESPRARRACFQKAIEALTPKSRRGSVDKKPDSKPGSPAPSGDVEAATPGRRTRRANSTQSTEISTKIETPRRTKKN